MKKETLEEVAERYSKKSSASVFQEAHKKDFIAGAKWQMERSYSEKEFAIGFAEWLTYNRENNYKKSTKELLEIYKKEKGL